MPVRRVASSGFGGASPGLRILQGQAEGQLKREEIDRENQRQAIRNRLVEQQTESLAQSSRLEAANAEHDKNVYARLLETEENTRQTMIDFHLENNPGVDPESIENITTEAFKLMSDQRLRDAQIGSAEASAGASRSRTQVNISTNQAILDERAMKELAALKDFYHIATFDGSQKATPDDVILPDDVPRLDDKEGLSMQSRLAALQAGFPDTEPHIVLGALTLVRDMEEKLRNLKDSRVVPGGIDPREAGKKPASQRILSAADNAENGAGSVNQAIKDLRVKIESMKAIEKDIADKAGEDKYG